MKDINGNEIQLKDLQAKGPWCATGEKLEHFFIKEYGGQFSLSINPEKLTNKYAPDLINVSNGKLGDLKTQNTPFFWLQINTIMIHNTRLLSMPKIIEDI